MCKILFILLSLGIGISLIQQGNSTKDIYLDESESNNFEADEVASWRKLMATVNWNNFLNFFQSNWKNTLISGNVSVPCSKSLMLYFEGLKKWEAWAIKMADATAKIPSGIMTQTGTDFGSFDECLTVKANEYGSESFKGKFCMVELKTPLLHPVDQKAPSGKSYLVAHEHPPEWISDMMDELKGYLKEFSFCFGICLPSTCTEEDIYSFFQTATKPWISKVKVSDCQVNEPSKWPVSAVISICILIIFLGICLVATVIDILDHKKFISTREDSVSLNDDFYRKLLKCFSISANSAKVFEKRDKKHYLDALNGIRFFISIWVILSHVAFYPERWAYNKYTSASNLIIRNKIVLTPMVNAAVNMENFSVISGFLLVYSLKKKLDKSGGKLDFAEFIIQKVWRLTPPFVFFFLLLNAIPVMSSGPIWSSTWENELNKCRKTWWWNLSFLHNFLHIDDLCLTHSWYLGCWTQMLIAGLFLIVLTHRSPKLGIIMGSVMVVACISITYNTSMSSGFYMFTFSSLKDFNMVKDFLSKIYFSPFDHFASMVCGMILGWIVLTYHNIKLPTVFRSIGWIISISIYITVLFGVWIPTTNFRIISLYYALRTLLWGLSTCWGLFCCFSGYGGIVNKFFSEEVFIPFSRISYSLYVFHPMVILFNAASTRERIYAGMINKIYESLATIVISVFLAYIACITIEMPFCSLYDLLHTKYVSKLKRTSIGTKFEAKSNGQDKNCISSRKIKSF